MIRKLLSVYVLAHSGFVIRCCHMAESLFILEQKKKSVCSKNVPAFSCYSEVL